MVIGWADGDLQLWKNNMQDITKMQFAIGWADGDLQLAKTGGRAERSQCCPGDRHRKK